jgi:hypothetical protein
MPADGRGIEQADGSLLCELPGGARALFTARARGNLSTMRGDGHEHGRERRDQMCAELGLEWLCASRQVHGTAVQRVGCRAGAGWAAAAIDADGHATACRGLGMMVLTADCLPVALGSEHAVAMLHAGWRGLAAGVLEEGVRALKELGGRDQLTAVIGPGAGACCYEVGAEVRSAFAGAGTHMRGNIDLHAIARERLLAAGVAEVRDLELCTICDARWFSHRREGARAGRQAGVAWLS